MRKSHVFGVSAMMIALLAGCTPAESDPLGVDLTPHPEPGASPIEVTVGDVVGDVKVAATGEVAAQQVGDVASFEVASDGEVTTLTTTTADELLDEEPFGVWYEVVEVDGVPKYYVVPDEPRRQARTPRVRMLGSMHEEITDDTPYAPDCVAYEQNGNEHVLVATGPDCIATGEVEFSTATTSERQDAVDTSKSTRLVIPKKVLGS